ncbi:MAG: UvrD-helicase domain-containing protein [Acidobacteria bacterium]|nr:UvrD-helicase domain-containing protein [Acidobacteriota bacterium]
MEFRIADTFTDSLARLRASEQKAAKTTAFDLQVNPSHPGLRFHRVDSTRDRNFWSVRAGRDLRIIVHRTSSSFLICYVDHHDQAYRWAERRRLERHPRTGAAQLVEIREIVREVETPRYVQPRPDAVTAGVEDTVARESSAALVSPGGREAAAETAGPAGAEERAVQRLIFAERTDDELLGYGVPGDWLEEAKSATEDTLLELAEHLPAEAAEALLELATGGTPPVPVTLAPGADPFAHPDAERRFRIVADREELERALDAPWEKWAVFLHPAQRALVERDYGGPARVAGSAGTGKTIVALHRAVHLAESDPDSRVLLATFSEPLAEALRGRLRLLIGNRPRLGERIEVQSMAGLAQRLYELNVGALKRASDDQQRELLHLAGQKVRDYGFSDRFLWAEWSSVVDAWQLKNWDEYREVPRLGRRTRLAEPHRKMLWGIFAKVREELERQDLLTTAAMFGRLEEHFNRARRSPFDHYVIDEAQDISVAELRFLAALSEDRPNSLFFAGDLGQRIFRAPFSWRKLGVDVRGRSRTLRVNYRTSHQIRRQADRLLPPKIADVDGIEEDRRGTVSVFNGPEPEIRVCGTVAEETASVGEWLRELSRGGIGSSEAGLGRGGVGLFVRSSSEIERALRAVEAAGLEAVRLGADESVTAAAKCGDSSQVDAVRARVSVGTMHRAKGLEFSAVAVMACDDDALPLQARIENVADEADLEDAYNTERHLLYVACTRARDRLLVTGVDPASEFLDDLA